MTSGGASPTAARQASPEVTWSTAQPSRSKIARRSLPTDRSSSTTSSRIPSGYRRPGGRDHRVGEGPDPALPEAAEHARVARPAAPGAEADDADLAEGRAPPDHQRAAAVAEAAVGTAAGAAGADHVGGEKRAAVGAGRGHRRIRLDGDADRAQLVARRLRGLAGHAPADDRGRIAGLPAAPLRRLDRFERSDVVDRRRQPDEGDFGAMGGVTVVVGVDPDLGRAADFTVAGRQSGGADHDPEDGRGGGVDAVGGGQHPLPVDERGAAEVGGSPAGGEALQRGHERIGPGGRRGAADDAGLGGPGGGDDGSEGQGEGGEDKGRRDPRAHEAGHGSSSGEPGTTGPAGRHPKPDALAGANDFPAYSRRPCELAPSRSPPSTTAGPGCPPATSSASRAAAVIPGSPTSSSSPATAASSCRWGASWCGPATASSSSTPAPAASRTTPTTAAGSWRASRRSASRPTTSPTWSSPTSTSTTSAGPRRRERWSSRGRRTAATAPTGTTSWPGPTPGPVPLGSSRRWPTGWRSSATTPRRPPASRSATPPATPRDQRSSSWPTGTSGP